MRIFISMLMFAAVLVTSDNREIYAELACGGECPGAISPPNAVVLMCPKGDTENLSELGVIVTLPFGAPVPEGSIYAMEACGNIAFCVPPQVDGPPDSSGTATFSGALIGGGQTDKWLWASGMMPEPPCIVVEINVRLVSPDINGDLKVNLLDFALFAMAWPPAAYDYRFDFNGDSMIGLVDLALMAGHFGHEGN